MDKSPKVDTFTWQYMLVVVEGVWSLVRLFLLSIFCFPLLPWPLPSALSPGWSFLSADLRRLSRLLKIWTAICPDLFTRFLRAWTKRGIQCLLNESIWCGGHRCTDLRYVSSSSSLTRGDLGGIYDVMLSGRGLLINSRAVLLSGRSVLINSRVFLLSTYQCTAVLTSFTGVPLVNGTNDTSFVVKGETQCFLVI